MTMNKLTGLLVLSFVGQITSMIIDGQLYGAAAGPFINTINNLLGFNVSTGGGWATIQMGVGFLTDGVGKLFFWNYQYLEGGLFLVRIFLFILTIVGLYGLWQGLRGNPA